VLAVLEQLVRVGNLIEKFFVCWGREAGGTSSISLQHFFQWISGCAWTFYQTDNNQTVFYLITGKFCSSGV